MKAKNDSKEELIDEIQELRSKLSQAENQQKELREELEDQQFQLTERKKELAGIYQIARLTNHPDNSTDYVLKQSIRVLTQSYLYPTICCGRITCGKKVYTTDNYKPTNWKQSVHAQVDAICEALKIEIYYLMEMPALEEGPFLKEERNMLETVANELAVYINRKQAEEETRQNEQKFKSLFNSMLDAIFIHDPEGNMLEVNHEATRRLNYSKEELLQMTPIDIDTPENASKAPDIFNRVMKEKHFRGETVHITRDNQKIPTEINANRITFKGRPAILTVARDITRRKQYEKELLEAKEKAEESASLKSAFLANLSHEIRTPLNAILGFADLLKETSPDEAKRHEFITSIRQSGDKLLSILNDILDVSYIEANQIQINSQPFSLNGLIDELAEQARYKMEKAQKNLQLKIRKPLPDQNDWIRLDHQKMHQIFTKLIDNAIKFTHSGYIEMGYEADSRGNLDFYIRDTGIGVPRDSRELIFERFRQLDHGITRQYEGLGLGLSIARGLVRSMGGSIKFHSSQNNGSTVVFKIPRQSPKDQQSTGQTTPSLPSDWSGKTILIAEDDATNYFLLNEFIKGTHARIKHAENGAQAVEAVKNAEAIDLILMDIKMPVLDGVAALKQIKQFNPQIPVIAITAYAYEHNKQQFLEEGFDGYISKPVKQDEFIQMVESKLIKR